MNTVSGPLGEVYRIGGLPPRPRVVFTSQEDGLEPPDPDFLAVHLAIAEILAASGLGHRIDTYLYECDMAKENIIPDGSSDLGSMISRQLMRLWKLGI